VNEIQRRVDSAFAGRRDPQKDYDLACSAVKRSHAAFKASRDKKGVPSAQASDMYARSLHELDVSTRVLEIFQALPKAS